MDGHDILSMYTRDKLGTSEISAITGISVSTIRRRLIAAGVELRSSGEGLKLSLARRETPRKPRSFTEEQKREAVQWLTRGRKAKAKGVSLKQSGYLEITSRDSPNYQRGSHVVLMEQHIGRRICRGEVVHHKDGNKINNDISNLELMSLSEHSRLHRIEERDAGLIRPRSNNGKFTKRRMK